jgi:hypothetical protein
MADISESPVVTDNDTRRDLNISEKVDYFGDENKSLDDGEMVKGHKDEESLNSDEYKAKGVSIYSYWGILSTERLPGQDDDSAYNVLPQIVRELCDFEDDVNTPVLTWR